ncbi:uncharacterized protein VP01_2854g3 [Puccinia sorghi]|uniref:Uncharacterized protein n=1 Tax=Puccinia sorghi TaxID=27349 RepID=A0A0L6V202_9BASI|nr:uncharacterized protein VP01_2854g3 [Puccinia sorghi]
MFKTLQFTDCVNFFNSNHNTTNNSVQSIPALKEIEISTQWNFTFHMFHNEDVKASKYQLLVAKWTREIFLMNLLEPLCEATEILCRSNYPPLNKALPIYILLIKHLKRVQHGLYYQALLIHPASLIITKIQSCFISEFLVRAVHFLSIILLRKNSLTVFSLEISIRCQSLNPCFVVDFLFVFQSSPPPLSIHPDPLGISSLSFSLFCLFFFLFTVSKGPNKSD